MLIANTHLRPCAFFTLTSQPCKLSTAFTRGTRYLYSELPQQIEPADAAHAEAEPYILTI